ncbi:terpene synthase family protein [Chitinophaga sancti]|uniref:terpene synthase family protein n=1 Tax=Chitinophaga sancti TaxID=1004 RepID=UPI002A754851|nr:terpene synthase family protein [Chitinophaga sancti]WPQ61890.1 terpene synthase family protein [Chitinophaga sancti]
MKKAIKMLRNSFLENFKGQYDAYLNTHSAKISLLRAFSFGEFNLQDYCANFYPHPKNKQLVYEAKSYCDQYGIWLDNAAQYITCAIYLFSSGHGFRMKPLLQNCAVDFYLNDTWGRELFAGLDTGEQTLARQVIKRISTDSGIMNPPENAHQIELATREMMLEFKRTSPAGWYQKFSRLYNYHVKITHKDLNADQLGRVLTVEEYIEARCHISGMHHTLTFLEYAEGQFLNTSWIKRIGLKKPLERLNFVVAAIGALMNDLFSFEKEVIDHQSDCNLVAIIALNNPAFSIEQVLEQAAAVVRNLLAEYLELSKEIQMQGYLALPHARTKVDVLENYLNGLNRVVMASWIWQISTTRYKRQFSIWEETTSHQAVTV